MNSSKKIEINRSTLVSLKAELSRKQQEVSQAKAHGQLVRPPKEKKITIWSKQNVGVSQRDERDAEQIEEENKALKNSRSTLEAKARLYDQLSSAGCSKEDTAQAQATLLVDFKQKQRDSAIQAEKEEEEEEEEGQWSDHPSDPDDEWVDYTDCLGRTRKCLRSDLETIKKQDNKLSHSLVGAEKEEEVVPEVVPEPPPPPPKAPSPPLEQQLVSGALHREALRAKWEQEEHALKDKDSIHYQDLLYDEVRNHGVSYFEFSRDEKERRAQQEKLAKVRTETRVHQAEAKNARARREQQLRARLRAAANRKRERQGLPPLPDSDGEKERGASDEEAEVERLLLGSRARAAEEPVEPEPMTREERPAANVTRPWDMGKERTVLSQEEWNEKKRAERKSEFAPPSTSTQGFHSGGNFYLDTKPISKNKNPEARPKVDKMDALKIPRKTSAPPRQYSSSSSEDEVIGPMPVPINKPAAKKQKKNRFSELPDMSVPPPGFMNLPAQNLNIPMPESPSTSTVKPKISVIWKSSFGSKPIPKQKPKRVWSDVPPPEKESVRGKGVEIAPPTSMDYHIGLPKRTTQIGPMIANKKEVESAISAGLSLLRKQAEEKDKNKFKKTFDN